MERDLVSMMRQAERARRQRGLPKHEQVLEAHRVESPLLYRQVRDRALHEQAGPPARRASEAEVAARSLARRLPGELEAHQQAPRELEPLRRGVPPQRPQLDERLLQLALEGGGGQPRRAGGKNAGAEGPGHAGTPHARLDDTFAALHHLR
jgi:hypothetical protein